eukprot:8036965-Alexandrium_andersonii.AAC.1
MPSLRWAPHVPARPRSGHHTGKMNVPETIDATPVSLAQRGNKRKVPGWGAVPMQPDEKDKRIAELEA